MRWLRLPEVESKTGLKKSKIYRDVQLGKFPRPHKVGAVSVWIEDELTAWQRALLDQEAA
jgi:prophage regulatory protein